MYENKIDNHNMYTMREFTHDDDYLFRPKK